MTAIAARRSSTSRSSWLRWGTFALALAPASVAIWALLAPRSFYDDFPVDGHPWVAGLGPYDEHLVRDVGALNLGMAVLLVAAAVSLAPVLVRVALASYALSSLPHLAFHIAEHGMLSSFDAIAGALSVAVTVVAPLALLALARPREQPTTKGPS